MPRVRRRLSVQSLELRQLLAVDLPVSVQEPWKDSCAWIAIEETGASRTVQTSRADDVDAAPAEDGNRRQQAVIYLCNSWHDSSNSFVLDARLVTGDSGSDANMSDGQLADADNRDGGGLPSTNSPGSDAGGGDHSQVETTLDGTTVSPLDQTPHPESGNGPPPGSSIDQSAPPIESRRLRSEGSHNQVAAHTLQGTLHSRTLDIRAGSVVRNSLSFQGSPRAANGSIAAATDIGLGKIFSNSNQAEPEQHAWDIRPQAARLRTGVFVLGQSLKADPVRHAPVPQPATIPGQPARTVQVDDRAGTQPSRTDDHLPTQVSAPAAAEVTSVWTIELSPLEWAGMAMLRSTHTFAHVAFAATGAAVLSSPAVNTSSQSGTEEGRRQAALASGHAASYSACVDRVMASPASLLAVVGLTLLGVDRDNRHQRSSSREPYRPLPCPE